MCGTGTKIALNFLFFLKNQNWRFLGLKVKNHRTLDLTSLGVYFGVLIQAFFFKNKVGQTTAICTSSTFGAASSLPMWK
jgi:hypothetical protein